MLIKPLKLFTSIRFVFASQKRFRSTFNSNLLSGECAIKETMHGEQYKGLPLSNVVTELNKFAALSLAESWDNVGLLIEPFSEQSIKSVLLTNDLTENVMEEAIRSNINLIISYHPPIFAPLKRITQAHWKERIVAACLENRIAVYSPHTSWDAVHGGVNDWLADAFIDYCEDNGRTPLIPIVPNNCLYITHLIGEPVSLDKIKKEFHFNNIFECSNYDGKAILGVVCSRDILLQLKQINEITIGTVECKKNEKLVCGMGRFLRVKGLNLSTCVQLLKKHTTLPYVRLALARGKNEDSEVSSIAVVAGSGGTLLKPVKADLWVTGEMFHHDILDANHMGTSIILTNHSDSERGFLLKMDCLLKNTFSNNINIIVSSVDSDPLKTV